MQNEQDRVTQAQFGVISPSKSFDEIRDEKQTALGNDLDSSDDSSLMSECISEMRRRRIYQQKFHRPYPTKSVKRHILYQLGEEMNRPAVLLSPSFSETDSRSSVTRMASSFDNAKTESSGKVAGRVLWNEESPGDDLVLVSENTLDAEELNDSTTTVENPNNLSDEGDEIMTPVRVKKFSYVYDDLKNESDAAGPAVNQETVTEISEGTKALAAFVTSAAGVIKEAKTPEKAKPEPALSDTASALFDFSGSEVSFNHALKLFTNKALDMAATPANKLNVQTPMTGKTLESIEGEPDVVVTKLGADNNDAAEKLEHDVLWPSLFVDAEGEVESSSIGNIDPSNKAMLEALVKGGALQREIDEKNVLKLFVDMYQRETFQKIVGAVQELKGLQDLVICRAVDKTRPTYRTSQEIASLFDATREIHQIDSVTLMNFDSSSMTNLAMMIHGQPLLFRLQIQLLEGTLNGEILGVMATAPRLTHVTLDLKESCSLGTLMNSKTLQSVRINSKDLELKKSHVRTLIYSLQSNFTLTTLDLAPAISVEHFQSLCVTLRQNFRLESLRVNVQLDTDEESNTTALELANLFRENNLLLNVWNYSHRSCAISSASKRDLVAALRSNKSMQEFKFFSEDIDDWRNAKASSDGNPSWLKRNLSSTPATDGSTVLETTEDYDESESFYSRASAVVNESLKGDDSIICGLDCSTMSPTFDCNVNVRQMTMRFQNWANAKTANVNGGKRTMEV
jgi:hypothetical protein